MPLYKLIFLCSLNRVWAFEPNDLGAKEKCGVIYRNGRFADLNCNNTENYICMKQNTSMIIYLQFCLNILLC